MPTRGQFEPSGGASAQWTVADPCASSDGPAWNDIPASGERIAFTTALEPDPVDAAAHLRFALRASTDQSPGGHVAPISFDVLAPG